MSQITPSDLTDEASVFLFPCSPVTMPLGSLPPDYAKFETWRALCADETVQQRHLVSLPLPIRDPLARNGRSFRLRESDPDYLALVQVSDPIRAAATQCIAGLFSKADALMTHMLASLHEAIELPNNAPFNLVSTFNFFLDLTPDQRHSAARDYPQNPANGYLFWVNAVRGQGLRHEGISRYRIGAKGRVDLEYQRPESGPLRKLYEQEPWAGARKRIAALYDEPLTKLLAQAREDLFAVQQLVVAQAALKP